MEDPLWIYDLIGAQLVKSGPAQGPWDPGSS